MVWELAGQFTAGQARGAEPHCRHERAENDGVENVARAVSAGVPFAPGCQRSCPPGARVTDVAELAIGSSLVITPEVTSSVLASS
jgi:hypothetical protein